MEILRRFFRWLEITWMQLRMLWRYKARSSDYLRTRQWFNVGRDAPPAEVYEQLMSFVREAVSLSPRPYGKGAYGLVLAAIWEDSSRDDRWETTFLYDERQVVYERIATRLESWSPPPLAIMVGILPYGSLALAATA